MCLWSNNEMAREPSKNDSQEVNFIEEDLFELECLIRATDIRHSARCEAEGKQILAFTVGTSELGLYYLKNVSSLPIIKRVPWFTGSGKEITALCFDPSGSWLLTSSSNGSLYIVPALDLVGEKHIINQIWTTDDITSFTSLNSRSSFASPSALAWWQVTTMSVHIGIIGTEQGEIVFVNLESGQRVNTTRVAGYISSLQICNDSEHNTVTLLITSQTREQWQLVLEQSVNGYVYPLDNDNIFHETYSFTSMHTNDNIDDGTKNLPVTRSRLRGLKQLSVEKLVILKQKLAETRNRNLMSSFIRRENGNTNAAEEITDEYNNDFENKKANDSSLTMCLVNPTQLPDGFLTCQYTRKGVLVYTCYYSSTNCALIYEHVILSHPISMHKLPEQCADVLSTQQLFYVIDTQRRTLQVISRALSEVQMGKESEFNKESIVSRFSFDRREEIINIVYIASSAKNTTTVKHTDSQSNVKYTIPSRIEDIHMEMPFVDSCIIITNFGIYKISLRKNLLSLFMEIVLERNDLEKARKLAFVFDLNIHQLLEYAGDILLSNQQFPRAIPLYKLSKCRPSKIMLKFALAGYTSKLLSCLIHCLAPPAVAEHSVTTRIHLSNLAILAFTEHSLRDDFEIDMEFLDFICTNKFYDELLAVNIAGQTCLWNILHCLATSRGLFIQVLDVLMKITFNSNNSHLVSFQNSKMLSICISIPGFIQGMLVNPHIARRHMNFVLNNLPDLQIFVLQRLITLYDPTNVALRPLLVRCKNRHRTTSHSSVSSQCDSLDSSDALEESNILVEEITETFLLILLTLIYKKTPSLNYDSRLIQRMWSIELEKKNNMITHNVDFRRRLLSTGYCHSALIRNGNVYTWGSAIDGCLGTGPTVLKFGLPEAITFFRRMEVEVFGVSCGRCHTLAVTNNGIYAWGGNQYGQLGIGELIQCPSPELVTTLAQEIIVDAVAGQYHSLALTMDGRVFSWGWGVHGQLGHGNTEFKAYPTLITALLGTMVKHISAGHAHTLVLSTEGIVYAFGCNVFGQLGTGNTTKSSIPVKITLLPEKISSIATRYFHNLAVSYTNKVYTWGVSPQVLRLQSQAYKKVKISEYHAAKEKEFQESAQRNEANKESSKSNVEYNNFNFANNTKSPNIQNKQNNSNKSSKSSKGINIGALKELQTHLTPSLVDTSLVRGQIIQISTGCHHSALLTKDGTAYIWGRNLDGQIGNGSRREVNVPSPLHYNPIPVSVPPRTSRATDKVNSTTVNEKDSKANHESTSNAQPESLNDSGRNNYGPTVKAVRICCGSDFTVAIQPGGTVLAWGNNSMAQLGRLPAKEASNYEKKLILSKTTKRMVRLPHATLDAPGQVPNIPSPIISYQSYDVTPLAGCVQPLSAVEKSSGVITLHYVLEHFTGLYDSAKILSKCIELENYQAAAKLALLENNYSNALSYQLKAIKTYSQSISNIERPRDLKDSIKIFDEQIEKNLINTLEESVNKAKMKMPASKSLDSFQLLVQEELFTFDCQGGSEELCDNSRSEDISLDITEDTLESDRDTEKSVSKTSTLEKTKIKSEKESCAERSLYIRSITPNGTDLIPENHENEEEIQRKNEYLRFAIEVVEFYINEIDEDAHGTLRDVLQLVLDFWVENRLPIGRLENVLLKHMKKLFYPLGMLLFCQKALSENLNSNESTTEIKGLKTMNSLSTKFCLQICSMLLQHIDQDKPTPEYIEILSLLMAKHYGPPLTGYPGSSENKTPEQMIEGVISTITSTNCDPKPFIHIRDQDGVSRFLAVEEDTVVFTCGHHFPISTYKSEVVPRMEAELLVSRPLPLPCTAQYLGNAFSNTDKPETLCPICIPRALQTVVKNVIDGRTNN